MPLKTSQAFLILLWAAGQSLLWSASCPPSALPLVSAGCFSHIFSLLSPTAGCCTGFFSLLKYIIPEVVPLSLMGLALASGASMLETAGTGSIRYGEASSSFPQKPPLKPPCYQNFATQTQYRQCPSPFQMSQGTFPSYQ